jgi:hypothetical protein
VIGEREARTGTRDREIGDMVGNGDRRRDEGVSAKGDRGQEPVEARGNGKRGARVGGNVVVSM